MKSIDVTNVKDEGKKYVIEGFSGDKIRSVGAASKKRVQESVSK